MRIFIAILTFLGVFTALNLAASQKTQVYAKDSDLFPEVKRDPAQVSIWKWAEEQVDKFDLGGALFDGKYSSEIIDKQGKKLTFPKGYCYKGGHFSEGLIRVYRDETSSWAFVDSKGQVRINLSPSIEWVKEFSEGLARVGIGECVGFINREGKVVIEPIYAKAENFSEGFALVQLNNRDFLDSRFGYINKTGKLVIPPGVYQAGSFSCGRALARKENQAKKRGFIDESGKFVIEPKYDMVADFSDGLALVLKDGKFFYINVAGERVSTFFDNAAPFSEGLASVQVDGKWGFIDTSGSIVIKPRFDHSSFFHDGLAVVRRSAKGKPINRYKFDMNSPYGYINRTGDFVVKPKFSNAFSFSDGMALVEFDNSKFGYINTKGEVILKLDPGLEAFRFDEGWATVNKLLYEYKREK